MASGVVYGLTRLDKDAMLTIVPTFEPPHSWAGLPEHRVVHVEATTEGRTLPQLHESVTSVKLQGND